MLQVVSYSLNSTYKLRFGDIELEKLDSTFVEVWEVEISARVAFLIWRSIRGRLLTKDNLFKRNIIGKETICYVLYAFNILSFSTSANFLRLYCQGMKCLLQLDITKLCLRCTELCSWSLLAKFRFGEITQGKSDLEGSVVHNNFLHLERKEQSCF